MKSRRWWGRSPLWARLVAGALALVAIGLTVAGVIGVTLFRDYLYNHSGQQLRAFAGAVAAARWDKPIRPGLNCGALPNDNATELIDQTGHVATASTCPATVSGNTATPDLPSDTSLQNLAYSGEPFTVTNRAKPTLRWQVVVVPFEYRELGSAHPGATIPTVADNLHGYVLAATNLNDIDATVNHLIRLEVAVDSAVAGALVLLGYAIVRTALRPLAHIETAAEAISAGDLSRRVPEDHPKTETGRLAHALNGMLGQIESAFSARERSELAARDSEQRMRRFVADASHELRTPLTSIRGFAELYRQGAADSRQMPDLIRRIEQEAVRMGLLVEDLLLLARLDQERPLARDPVHLGALAAESIAGAKVRAPDRPIELTVERAPGREPVVIGDETRLRQALDNLIDNALRHTPPDAQISVRVRPGAGAYLLEVADTGPGLSDQAAAHVFERFYRADPARTRADADGDRGSGLGLAIVAAITAAHGGTASVHSGPGKGAVFRLSLPTP